MSPAEGLLQVISNRYVLHNEIGSGGMGTVYRAYDRLTGQIIALKRVIRTDANLIYTNPTSTLHIGMEGNLSYRLALAQEFKMLASLRHPHIISVLDYGFDRERQPFFTMELLEDAQTIFEAGRFRPLNEKIHLLVEVLQALLYLHQRRILHRDLKPGNILVAAQSVKLLDFGLSITEEQARKQVSDDTAVGTLLYIAPEVLTGDLTTEAADLYAVGVIAYELISGQHPFANANVNELVHNIVFKYPDLSLLDIPFELVDVLERLLAKRPDQRYSSAYEALVALTQAAQVPLPPENAAIRESFLQAAQFVGRSREMVQLTSAFNHSMNHQGSAWLVGGESGVGKSRLLDELRTQALVEGALVTRGQAVSEGGLPYQLWRDVLRRLTLETTLSENEAVILKTLLPDISALLDVDLSNTPEPDAASLQQSLMTVIKHIFNTQPIPVVVLLEDMQWANDESLSILRELMPLIQQLPVLIVGSYRVDEAPDLPTKLVDTQVIKLDRLTKQEVTQLSISMMGEAGQQPQVVDFLHRETEGNVFFIVEVMRALAEEAGRLEHVGSATLPQQVFAGGIKRIVERRLSRIKGQDYRLLEASAVIGRQVDLDLLEILAPQADLESWLAHCADAAVLEVVDNGWRFTHDKLREGVLNGLTADQMRDLHRQVALAIEANQKTNEYAVKLMYHWANAGVPEKEREYAHIAGEMACRISSFREAIQLLNRALTLYQDDSSIESKHAQALIRARLGDANVSLGDVPTGQNYLRTSLEIGRTIGDQQIIANALRNLGIASFRQMQLEEAERQLEDSLHIAQEIGDRPGLATALYFLGAVNTYQGKADVGKQHIVESRRIRMALGDRWGVARTFNGLGEIAYGGENYQEAETNYLQALEIFKEIGDRLWIGGTLSNLGYSAFKQGKHQEAIDYFRESLQTALEVGSLPRALEAVAGVGCLFIDQISREQGARILGFALRHPSVDSSAKVKAKPSLEYLKHNFSEQDIELLMQQGQQLDFDAILSALNSLTFS
jgi:eukaryotic-like serine/threonine-protein kinase